MFEKLFQGFFFQTLLHLHRFIISLKISIKVSSILLGLFIHKTNFLPFWWYSTSYTIKPHKILRYGNRLILIVLHDRLGHHYVCFLFISFRFEVMKRKLYAKTGMGKVLTISLLNFFKISFQYYYFQKNLTNFSFKKDMFCKS